MSVAKLNERQIRLFNALADDPFEPILVTGAAGTGKSALLVALRDRWRAAKRDVAVTAYGNLTARNIDGRTIHSTFGFNFNLEPTNKHVSHMDYLIIDEISMVPEQMLDGIDFILRLNSSDKSHLPFGGVSVIVFGDLYQLPPIADQLPVYETDVWSSFRVYELTENMRQIDRDYVHNLNKLRVGDITCLSYFDRLVVFQPPSIIDKITSTSLVSTHREADKINAECYNYINSSNSYDFETQEDTIRWSPNLVVYNGEQEKMVFKRQIKLCVGARVMITHTIQNFCNGDTGLVKGFNQNGGVFIRRDFDDVEYELTPIKLYFNGKNVVRAVTGLPVNYGWAVTIHKAQGMTTKRLIVHPACLFAPGQAYVAVSRTINIEGLKLVAPIPKRAVRNMDHITNVYQSMKMLQI